MIMAIDALFWDSVSHALSYMRESKPDSLIVRTILNFMALLDKNGFTFNETRRFNVAEDFYQVLRGIGQENAHGPAIPVLIAKLIDNPLEVFAQKKFEPVLGAVFGQYLATFTGLNLGDQLALWLRRMSHVGLTAQSDEDGSYYDEQTKQTYSAEELAQIRAANEEFQRLMTETLPDYGVSPQEYFKSQSNSLSTGDSGKKQLGIVAAIANWAILKAVKDLPLFMQSLERIAEFVR
jgi:hypothetical protein